MLNCVMVLFYIGTVEQQIKVHLLLHKLSRSKGKENSSTYFIIDYINILYLKRMVGIQVAKQLSENILTIYFRAFSMLTFSPP